jgi:diacylglycerol kinase (ATP)
VSKQDILFIINPNSGNKKAKEGIPQLIDKYLEKTLFNSKIIKTEYAGHATKLTEEAVKNQVPYIVAIGGDGTVNEIAKVLTNTSSTLGIIPMGSGNGLAREMDISMKVEQAIAQLNSLRIRQIDSCFINEIPFFCTAGIGFEAHCADVFSRMGGRGFRNYVKVGLKEYWNYKPLSIVFGGADYQVFSMTFANSRQFGNDALVAPKASITDGFVDCTIVNPHPFLSAPLLIGQLFSGTLPDSRYVESFRGKKFSLESEKNFLIHFDGEPFQLNSNQLKVRIEERSLRILGG